MKTIAALMLTILMSTTTSDPPGYGGDSGENPPTGVYACGMEIDATANEYVLWVNDARFWDISYCPPHAFLHCWDPVTQTGTAQLVSGVSTDGEHTTPGGNKADWSLRIDGDDLTLTAGFQYYFRYDIIIHPWIGSGQHHSIYTQLF